VKARHWRHWHFPRLPLSADDSGSGDRSIVVAGAGPTADRNRLSGQGGLPLPCIRRACNHRRRSENGELTLPGFKHDTCSTAHNGIQGNPLMRNDELKLRDFG